MRYIIGDVHGDFEMLKNLISKLPKDSEIFFVGDLVDRGDSAMQVVDFVIENNYKCVLGNHEEMFIEYGRELIKYYYPNTPPRSILSNWLINGGLNTLKSYSLARVNNNGSVEIIENIEMVEKFKQHIEWLEALPLYIELEDKNYNKPIVISHSNISNVWHLRDKEDGKYTFRQNALWNRNKPKDNSEIFNIYGHTPHIQIDKSSNHINIDTGVYSYNTLSAYCIETKEVIQYKK